MCGFNKLASINLDNLTMLKHLVCSDNQLTSLDIYDSPLLEYLKCDRNNLTSLDVSHNTVIRKFSCYSNNLSGIDISKNQELMSFNCERNKIKELDITQNSKLGGLYYHQQCDITLKIDKKSYDKLDLFVQDDYMEDGEIVGGYDASITIENLHNVNITKITEEDEDSGDVWILGDGLKVIDISKWGTYNYYWSDTGNTIKYTGTIIYGDAVNEPLVTPSYGFAVPSCTHLFNDYDYISPVSGSAVIIYANGANLRNGNTAINTKQFTAYTDIMASYLYSTNGKGVVKASVGKVIAGITKSDTKPNVTKNKIVDKEAAKIAKARIKNGQVTVTATGKEKGLVYLWIIDTGKKGVYECCPINVQMAPKKLEVHDLSGNKLKNPKLGNNKTLDICVAGIASSNIKTNDCTYIATVDEKYKNYIKVEPNINSSNKFTITATGLKNNKNTKAVVVFKCVENGRKTSFSLIITE